VEDLRADVKTPGNGLIIESHMEQGRGAVAVALVESGTLRSGDFVVAGTTYAKVRNLESTAGQSLKQAGPSSPVVITGFKSLPEFGDEFQVVANEKAARAQAEANAEQRQSAAGSQDLSGGELLRLS